MRVIMKFEDHIDELEARQAQEEAHYWFALTDVVSHMEQVGVEKVLIDLAALLQERKELLKKKEDSSLDDLGF